MLEQIIAIQKDTIATAPTSFTDFIQQAAQQYPAWTAGVEKYLVEPASLTSPTLKRVAQHIQVGAAILDSLPALPVPQNNQQRARLHLLNADVYRFTLPDDSIIGFGQLKLAGGIVFDRHMATSRYREFYAAYQTRHNAVSQLMQRGIPLEKALMQVPWPRNLGKPPVVDEESRKLHEAWINAENRAFYERQKEREQEIRGTHKYISRRRPESLEERLKREAKYTKNFYPRRYLPLS